MTSYLVELYVPQAERHSIPPGTGPVRHLLSIVIPVDELCFCLLEGRSGAAVAAHLDAAGLEAERIVEVLIDPAPERSWRCTDPS